MSYVKHLAWSTILLLTFSFYASAETVYVAEIREITLRTGPGTEYKISAFIASGKTLSVLEVQENWTRVQTTGGKEGWVLSRFLQTKVPNAVALEKLQGEYTAVTEKKVKLASENQQLKKNAAVMEAELADARETLARLETDFATLKKDSADFIKLKSKLASTSKVLDETKAKADKFEKEFTMLYNDKRIKWFLVGTGVLLLGFIFGYATKPQRRKPTLR